MKLSTQTTDWRDGIVNKVVGKAHPNVFEIVEVFKAEQASTEVSLPNLLLELHRLDVQGERWTKTSELQN